MPCEIMGTDTTICLWECYHCRLFSSVSPAALCEWNCLRNSHVKLQLFLAMSWQSELPYCSQKFGLSKVAFSLPCPPRYRVQVVDNILVESGLLISFPMLVLLWILADSSLTTHHMTSEGCENHAPIWRGPNQTKITRERSYSSRRYIGETNRSIY